MVRQMRYLESLTEAELIIRILFQGLSRFVDAGDDAEIQTSWSAARCCAGPATLSANLILCMMIPLKSNVAKWFHSSAIESPEKVRRETD
jgi:hypothetical protein